MNEADLEPILCELLDVARQSHNRYGDYASTHEAGGVAMEEWRGLWDAIRENDLWAVRRECIDLAAVLVRLAVECQANERLRSRSVK